MYTGLITINETFKGSMRGIRHQKRTDKRKPEKRVSTEKKDKKIKKSLVTTKQRQANKNALQALKTKSDIDSFIYELNHHLHSKNMVKTTWVGKNRQIRA